MTENSPSTFPHICTAVALDGAYAARHFALLRCIQGGGRDYHQSSLEAGGPLLSCTDLSIGRSLLARSYGKTACYNIPPISKYWLYLALDGAYPLPDDETAHDWGKGWAFWFGEHASRGFRPEFKETPVAWRPVDRRGIARGRRRLR